MQEVVKYPKRLIEVDLPIKEISAHARREKSIRHGHISTLHLWWARRPLAACRAVICASLWPDPGDDLCPPEFQERAAKALCTFAGKVRTQKHLGDLCKKGGKRWQRTEEPSLNGEPQCAWELRYALLDFIADFANWDASNVPEFLEAARAITQAAHETLGGAKGTQTLLIDPFAGGGAIPLEGLRVGAVSFASDLNPVAVLLNKVVLELIPTHGKKLAAGIRTWGKWVVTEAEKALTPYYPKGPGDINPVAYLWARTIICEGPGCGASIPLMRSSWLSKRSKKFTGLKLIANRKLKRVDLEIVETNGKTQAAVGAGTVRLGSATCPMCGHTTSVERVRAQLATRHGGANDARLLCVVTSKPGQMGRSYRLPTEEDSHALALASQAFHDMAPGSLPDEPTPADGTGSLGGGYRTRKYGITQFVDFFTHRQAVALATLISVVRRAKDELETDDTRELGSAIELCLALAIGREVDAGSSLCRWQAAGEFHAGTFGRHALPIIWDFSEVPPLSEATGGFPGAIEWVARVCDSLAAASLTVGQTTRASATLHPLPSDVAGAVVTDPPYYDAVPYGELSDFFYVWLRRCLSDRLPALFESRLVPHEDECIVHKVPRLDDGTTKDRASFERTMFRALAEARRVTKPDGIGVIVFAHKSTSGWEAQLQAMLNAGWIVTGSWPIDTERGGRLRALSSAALGSSIHIVCRPRENPDGSLRMDDIGDWRDVLLELPKRIHEWMPRLAEEGVVGADAIFACLGPALEIFSRYSHVEDAAGHKIELRTYLEKVWETVAREALSVIFSGADAAGFEPDARLTAMWLWTLFSAASSASSKSDGDGDDEETDDEDDEDSPKTKSKAKVKGFALEFDAARKIAQGLGADLEQMESLVEIKGETARLLSVDERRKALFGKAAPAAEKAAKAAKKRGQLKLGFQADSGEEQEPTSDTSFGVGNGPVEPGATVLDRVHQAMLLFGANQSGSLKRFLVEQGVGRDNRFWSFADHLSKLYPAASAEKRLVDGVLARKKGLGF